MKREKITGLLCLLLMTFFVSRAVWNAAHGGSTSVTFLGFLLGWSSYLAAHYLLTGKLVHRDYRKEDLADPRDKTVLAAGVIMTLTGISSAVYQLNHGDFLAFSGSGALVTGGYITYHRSLYERML